MEERDGRKQRFSAMGKFSVISSLRVRTPEEAIFDIQDSERQGADGFLLHIELLDKQYQSAEVISSIIASANRPLMALDYLPEEDPEVLSSVFLNAVSAGAAAVDLPMYLFDKAPLKSLEGRTEAFACALPAEVSMDREAKERQKELISKLHEAGGEVLISAHVGKMLSQAQALALAEEMRDRGADIAKIIVRAGSADDVAEIYQTCCLLKKSLGIPFLYQTSGTYGKLVRPTAWMFGSRYVLCHNRYSQVSNREKPLIADVLRIKEELFCESSDRS